MTTLAINTASKKTAIALLESGKILNENSWESENNEAEKLMPAIDNLLKKSKKTYTDLDNVIVINGPGSFTGLRIGVSTANTIAYLIKSKLYAVDTFSYWWEGFGKKPDNTALLIFAGSGGVYFSKSPEDDPVIVNLDELNLYLKENRIKKVFGDISEDQKSILTEAKFFTIDITFGEIIRKIDTLSIKSVKIVKPRYIKKPGITISKKSIIDK